MVLRSLVVVSLVWPTLASNLMWFDAPTSIPIGNGRLGAQLMGEVPTETVALNEDRIWSGSLADTVPTTCLSNYPAIRNDVWEGQIADAQNSFGNFCMSNPLSMQSFQPAGNLTIAMSHGSTVSNYNHSLDLSSAIATTEYTVDGVTYTRSSFASNPDDVIVIQINASQPGSVSFTAGYITPMSNPAFSSSNSTLTLNAMGQMMEGLPASIKYTVQSNIRTMGSSANVTAANDHITVTNADSVTIVVAIATNFKRYDDLSGDPNSIVSGVLSAVSEKTFQSMLSTHLSDHQALYGRVDISLGSPTSAWYLPTDQRRLLPNGPDADADIFATYTQYGRYLAIASSRNTEPSNLQGVWNVETAPWWGSKYTLNINQQMNSWLLESLALPELLDPLWSMLDDVSVRGAETARVMYNASGWTVHHNTELWRDGPPIDGAFFGAWPFAGAWIAQHLFERYQFGLDVDFVRDTAYPLMKGLCEFYLDWLVDSPDGQYLTSNPSMSPEATFKTQDGISVSLTWGSTIDHSLMRDLFDNTVFFAGLLGLDSDFAAQVSAARARIYPWVLGSKGQIAEWASDTTVDIGEFSHMSHMYGLFPSAQIDPRLNATLASAAKMSLTLRGDSANGWPTAIRQNSWARLLDGEKAYYYFQRLLQLYSYANLWSYNDVWQIDANFGGASGLAEMLLQSHNGEVHLLPAVPAAWAQGSVSGFRARGGFAVDISWADGTLIHATLTSIGGTNTTVRYAGGTAAVSVSNGGLMTLTPASFNS